MDRPANQASVWSCPNRTVIRNLFKDMKIEPLDDNVLIDIIEPEKGKTGTGIIISSDAYDDELSVTGKVLKVGPKVTDISVEDIILFKKHLFDEVVVGTVTSPKVYLLGKREHITAKIYA